MQIFIKAVTAPDDERDIMHYETSFENEAPKIFASRKEALEYLLERIKERKEQLHQDLRHLKGSCADYDEYLYRAESIYDDLHYCEIVEHNICHTETKQEKEQE